MQENSSRLMYAMYFMDIQQLLHVLYINCASHPLPPDSNSIPKGDSKNSIIPFSNKHLGSGTFAARPIAMEVASL